MTNKRVDKDKRAEVVKVWREEYQHTSSTFKGNYRRGGIDALSRIKSRLQEKGVWEYEKI
jgi:hypothetical protein